MDRRSKLRILLLLLALAYLTYAGALWNGFAGWDDRTYVVSNFAAHGLSWSNVRRAFSQVLIGTYTPLQTISYALDYSLWGLRPYGYHATNLLLHSINSVLLYYVLLSFLYPLRAPGAKRLGGTAARPTAAIAAMVFVVHPAHVESVAWIAERKDVLSTLFLFWALLAYLRRSQDRTSQWGTLLWVLCGCLSKPTAVVFPLLLLLIECARGPGRRLRRVVPFLVVGGLFAAVGIAAQAHSGAIHPLHGGSVVGNYGTMLWVLLRYAELLLVPQNLSVLHWVIPSTSWAEVRVLAGAAFTVTIGFVWIRTARRSPLALWVGGWLLVPLVPVLNIIPLSVFMAERYLYLPMVGFGLLLVTAGRRSKKEWVLAAILVCYAALAIHRCWAWRGAQAMWTDAIRKSLPNPVAHYNLGVYFAEQGRLFRALREYRTAAAQDRGYMKARSNLGNLLLEMGQTQEAIAILESVARDFPRVASVHYNLGVALYRTNETRRALTCFSRAIDLNPRYWPAHLALAVAYARRVGNPSKAVVHLRALDGAELSPRDAATARALAHALGMRRPPTVRTQGPTVSP